MATLNLAGCASRDGNTGLPSSCVHNPEQLIGNIALPKGTVWGAAELADIRNTIQNGFLNATYTSRYQRFGRYEEIADNSEERTEQTFGYGNKVTVRGEKYFWTFTYIDGAFCAHKNYLKFKGRENEFDFLFVDNAGNIIGTEAYDTDGNLAGLKGVAVTEFRENNWKPNDGSATTVYTLNIGIADSADLNERYAFVTVDFDVFGLGLVEDVVLSNISTLAAGIVAITVIGGCGGQNFVESFPLIADASLFDIKNRITGQDIDADTVTILGSGQNSYLRFDLDDTDPDYPAVGEDITIKLKDVTTVAATLGINIESNLKIIEVAS